MKKLTFLTAVSVLIIMNINAQQLTNGISMQVQPNGYVISFNLPDYQIDTVQTNNNGTFSQIVMQNNSILNIENLTNGFYIVKILYDDNTFETNKLIINK